jgi:hypothetical protein
VVGTRTQAVRIRPFERPFVLTDLNLDRAIPDLRDHVVGV